MASANMCPCSSVGLGVRCLRCRPANFAAGDEGTEPAGTVLGVGPGAGAGRQAVGMFCAKPSFSLTFFPLQFVFPSPS